MALKIENDNGIKIENVPSTSGSTIKSLKKSKKNLTNLKTRLNKFASVIIQAKSDLNTMMKGDGTQSYWVGENAREWYTKAIKSLNSMMDNYAHSYREFADYARLVDRATAKSLLKTMKKSSAKAVLAKYTGSEYTAGVKANLNGEKISTILPSTVQSDASSDELVVQSRTYYGKLKKSLAELSSHCTKIENVWSAVKANTKGKMNTDANTRIKSIKVRKKEIDNCINVLEEDFIGDIIWSAFTK